MLKYGLSSLIDKYVEIMFINSFKNILNYLNFHIMYLKEHAELEGVSVSQYSRTLKALKILKPFH